MLNSPLLKPLHEYAWTLSLKLSQFCGSERHCFGKDPQCSPYLLQVIINPSFSWSLAWLCLLARCPTRGKPSFQVTSWWFPDFLANRGMMTLLWSPRQQDSGWNQKLRGVSAASTTVNGGWWGGSPACVQLNRFPGGGGLPRPLLAYWVLENGQT